MEREKRILFLQTAHFEKDDRVYYHQQQTLDAAGWICRIVSVYQKELNKRDLQKLVANEVRSFAPSVILCDTPVAVVTAKRALRTTSVRCAVAYDVTEWYPSKKNLRNARVGFRTLKGVMLAVLSVVAGCMTDAFLFGEEFKAKPFRLLFPWKIFMMLPYYPMLRYLHPRPAKALTGRPLRMFYAGQLTEEKGWHNVLNLTEKIAAAHAEWQFELTAVTDSRSKERPALPDNVTFVQKPYMPFEDFCSELGEHDIFLDLRKADFENTRCLPIKLFYYMGTGRPVIYSPLKAIINGVPELAAEVCQSPEQRLTELLRQPERITQEAERNEALVASKYNWDILADRFVDFIETVAL